MSVEKRHIIIVNDAIDSPHQTAVATCTWTIRPIIFIIIVT